jgi:hypothetical protein
MTAMRRFSAVLALVVLAIPLTASAQTSGEVADAVEFRGYYVDDGLDITINDLEDLVRQYPDIGFVALADDPDGGSDIFADDVLAAVDAPDTIVVLSPAEVGVVTDGVYTQAQIDGALDDAFVTTGDSYLTDFAQIAGALTGVDAEGVTVTTQADAAGPATAPGDESGGNGLVIFLAIVAGIVGLIWWLSRRGRRQRAEAAEKALEAAKSEIREQMGVIANEILEFSDRVDQDEHPDAVAHYRRASEVFKAAEDRMDAAKTPAELESLSDDLDEARWEMAAADAIVEGREVPPKPEAEKPVPCFFDPTHGAGTEEAQLETAAGTKTVMVCKQDANRLRRGEKPEPRSIDVGGGNRIPAPQAPRSSGGGGMDWLDAFSILVGGMSRGTDYSWGRSRYPTRRRRGGLGGLGGLFGASSASRRSSSGGIPTPPRRSSSSSRSRSSSKSTSSSRSSSRSRRSRSTSRGRRGR